MFMTGSIVVTEAADNVRSPFAQSGLVPVTWRPPSRSAVTSAYACRRFPASGSIPQPQLVVCVKL